MKYCKLSDYAKKFGVTYRTAFNRYRAGTIEGAIRDSNGHICVPIEYIDGPISNTVTIYASVSTGSDEDMKKLDEQVKTLTRYCNSRGYHIEKIVREISPSIHGERPKFIEILKDRNIKHIVVERRSNIIRYGFDYLETVLKTDQREIEAMIETEDQELLLNDSIKYIYLICKTLGGNRIPKKSIRALLDKLIINANTNLIEE